MPHHYTKDTESDTAYCRTCGRRTQHRVEDRRLGRCMEHDAPQLSKRQLEQRARRKKEAANPRLF